jgi:GT2 family glycosyltransferase
MESIYVIVPVFEGWAETKRCLDALRASTYRPFKVIAVNHGTSPEIRQGLSTQYPEVLQLSGSPSLWWAGATNLGIRHAMDLGAKKIMLVNHDCYVEPETLERLVAHANRVTEAIIAPVPLDYATKQVLAVTVRTCFLLGFPMIVFPGQRNHVGKSELLRTKLILGGRGVLIPTPLFRRYGVFDEVNLPSYYSDFDYFLRCRQRGIPLYIAADAKVYIDDTRTTLATNLGNLTMREFLETYCVPRSHRNLQDLSSLFRFHYPVRGLHWIGVALNALRYLAIYLIARLKRLLFG